MAWPLSQDYNEAIQSPASSFADADLRAGEAVVNAVGLPMPRSGNFADVYEFHSPQGRWALKFFTREIPNLRERYRLISEALADARLPFTVDFQFLDRGIRIRGEWYPVLKMQWVDGFLLNEFVRDNLDKPQLLEGMLTIWVRMAQRLRDAGIAHADIQHGNVILVPGRKESSLAIKLIDYDGMFVPSLAKSRSGEVGHANFQHPTRLRTGDFDAEVDRFSLLVVACALRALTIGGRPLWDRFDNGDNLLFREADFRNPAASPVFKALRSLPDPTTQILADSLAAAAAAPLDQCPLLESLVELVQSDGRTGQDAHDQPGSRAAHRTMADLAKSKWPLMGGAAALVIAIASWVAFRDRGSKPEIKAEVRSKPSEPEAPSDTAEAKERKPQTVDVAKAPPIAVDETKIAEPPVRPPDVVDTRALEQKLLKEKTQAALLKFEQEQKELERIERERKDEAEAKQKAVEAAANAARAEKSRMNAAIDPLVQKLQAGTEWTHGLKITGEFHRKKMIATDVTSSIKKSDRDEIIRISWKDVEHRTPTMSSAEEAAAANFQSSTKLPGVTDAVFLLTADGKLTFLRVGTSSGLSLEATEPASTSNRLYGWHKLLSTKSP